MVKNSKKRGDKLNNSGIYSLAGFAYQIKVFIYYLTILQENYTLGYETFDDIALQKGDMNGDVHIQEEKLQTYNGIFNSLSGITVLQVKRTSLSGGDFEKILFNWILLKNYLPNVDKFVLLVDKSYGNTDNVFPANLKLLYDKIVNSKKKGNALITKVKNTFKNNYPLFCGICKEIESKYEFKEIDDIDKLLFESYKSIFNHGGVNDSTYRLRIIELIKKIEYEILTNISENNEYTCDYNRFKSAVEDINFCVRNDSYLPAFSDFRNRSRINIINTDIAKSRQYLQLTKCSIGEQAIKEQLIFEEYYNSYKLRCLEDLKQNKIDDIEITTYDNFDSVKSNLQANKRDNPNNRLMGTQERANSYAPNDQIRSGSAIHLTKADTDPIKLISWEDEN